jgi:outer membrane protein TolC
MAQKAELSVQAQNESIINMNPEFDLYKIHEIPTAEKAYYDALERSRVLKALKIRLQQLESGREGFVETKRPDLNLGLGVGIKGGDPKFDESLTLDKPDFFASLIFTKPIGNTAAQADIARSELQIRQLQFEIDKYSLDLKSSLSSLLIQLTELEKVLELNRREIESAGLKTEEEIKLYNQGRGDLSFVIQSQDNEENARLVYAENAANYQKLVLSYKELTDRIISNNEVER